MPASGQDWLICPMSWALICSKRVALMRLGAGGMRVAPADCGVLA